MESGAGVEKLLDVYYGWVLRRFGGWLSGNVCKKKGRIPFFFFPFLFPQTQLTQAKYLYSKGTFLS